MKSRTKQATPPPAGLSALTALSASQAATDPPILTRASSLLPALPQVDLLPPEIRTARTAGVVRRWFLVCAGMTGLAVAVATGTAQYVLHGARDDLAHADAEAAELADERGTFTDVTRLRADLTTMKAARAYALGDEVLWSEYLGAVVAVTPDGVGINDIDYTGSTPQAAAQPSTDPLVRTGVGTLTFTARAASLPDTAAWADALDSIPGLRDVRVTTTALTAHGEPLQYQLTGTIQVDEAALAQRFDAETGGGS